MPTRTVDGARERGKCARLCRGRVTIDAVYEERASRSPLIRCVWQASGMVGGDWSDPASEYWGLLFSRFADGSRSVELAGPSIVPRVGTFTAGDHHWGVDLEAHVFWRGLDKAPLRETMRTLPVDGDWFLLAGVRYPITDIDGLETLVGALGGQGVLVSDPVVAQALAGESPAVSERTLQRLVPRTTGLRRVQITQLRRARLAYRLLQDGSTIAGAAAEAGYADQAHMTRAFGMFVGQSPARILALGSD